MWLAKRVASRSRKARNRPSIAGVEALWPVHTATMREAPGPGHGMGLGHASQRRDRAGG